MMWGDPITTYLLGKLLDVIPPWIMRRVTNTSKIESQILVDLNRANAVSVFLYSSKPYMELRFEITNGSMINVDLDRLLFDMWVGQPLLKDAVLDIYDIPQGKTKDDIRLYIPLSGQQADQIKNSLNTQGLVSHVLLDVRAYFDTKIGRVHVKRRIERTDVPLKAGPP